MSAMPQEETSVAVRLKPGRIVRKRLHPIAQLRRMYLKRRARRADAAVAPVAATTTSTIITMLRVTFPPFLTPAGRTPECLKRPPKHFTRIHTIREFARLPLAARWLRDDNSEWRKSRCFSLVV